MAFARIETGILNHRKFGQMSLEQIGLWTLALAYSMDQLSDGRVPKFWLSHQFGVRAASDNDATVTRVRSNRNVARLERQLAQKFISLLNSMVTISVFEDAGQDILIHDYQDWNPSAAQIKADRQAARDRMRKSRGYGERSRERSRERALARSSEVPSNARQIVNHVRQQDVEVDVDKNPPVTFGRTESTRRLNKPHRCFHDSTCPEARVLDPSGLTGCSTPDGRPLFVWPTREIKSRHNETRWLPGAYPYAAYRHDCAEKAWRGRCVIPGAPGAQEDPRQCPEHRAPTPNPC